MPARPISSATVSFGLVSVPVQLYSAAESSANVSFNLLHKKCGSRLKQQYFCQKDGEKVERDDMVKGYKLPTGQFVQFTKEELKALEEKKTESINITEFVPLKDVDRIYLDKVYYLGPDKGGERAYKLLAAALKETGRAALGQYAARGKQYLILVRPMDGVLVMEQLYYQDEMRSAREVPISDVEVKDQELKLAIQLIEQGASDAFRPEAYSDTVKARMLEQIQKKIEGQEITEEPSEAPQTQIIDLMEALKASLAKGKTGGERKPAQGAAQPAAGPKRAAKRKAS
ncbi:MAG TPA: Ku protein [Gemmatimonadales bacterium]|nr:Ku protein [Gemmatimonadales bacterium]